MPARSGSSLKYSKLRPQTGERLILVPGPRIVETSSFKHSSARATPSSLSKSSSQEQAEVAAGGKQVAGTEFPRPIPLDALLSLFCLRRP